VTCAFVEIVKAITLDDTRVVSWSPAWNATLPANPKNGPVEGFAPTTGEKAGINPEVPLAAGVSGGRPRTMRQRSKTSTS
jgi:hypothetical protein